MKKVIVATSIYNPTEATRKFCQKSDWDFIMIADRKTPIDGYLELEKQHNNFRFISCEEQEKKWPKLGSLIGWNSIDRRNLGFCEALKEYSADIIATVDDDNIPYESWGKDLLVGKTVEVDIYETSLPVFDPLAVFDKQYWHRGYPLELVNSRKEYTYKGKQKRSIHVQADLWDGDPDIDAIARQVFKPIEKFPDFHPFVCDSFVPFNSQNTFLHKSVFPEYMCIPHIGRMDDIWGAYILQMVKSVNIAFCPASVFQERNPHTFHADFAGEQIGYLNKMKIFEDWRSCLPNESMAAYEKYRELLGGEKKETT